MLGLGPGKPVFGHAMFSLGKLADGSESCVDQLSADLCPHQAIG